MPLITTYKAKPPKGFFYPTSLSEINQHCPGVDGHVGFHFHATTPGQWEKRQQALFYAHYSPGMFSGYYAKKGLRPPPTLSVSIYAIPLDAAKRFRADIDRAKSALYEWMKRDHTPHGQSHLVACVREGVMVLTASE